MPYFSEETLQAVRAIPLYEIVRPTVELSRVGHNWRGLSPFTNEKSPSFFIITDKNFFKCHSSGLAGDGIRFIQETEKLPFPEAVTFLAERFNIPVHYADGQGPDPEKRSLRQHLLQIHEYATDYYHRAFLADNCEAAAVRHYWSEERGFSLELAREFRIGYAPPHSRKLLQNLLDKGFSPEVLAQSGLFFTGREQTLPTDRWFFLFRGRLMIPIRDIQGQPVAFTARQLPQTPTDQKSHKAKYLNSLEHPLFQKGQMLFNLDRARDAVRQTERFLMVEGQLDALRCFACGLTEAVAPQGTSITADQLKLLHRYTHRLDLLLDSDPAGARAILRILPTAFEVGLEVGVYQLPQSLDPDDFLRQQGADGLASIPRLSSIRFAAKALLPDDSPTPEQRARALHEVFDILKACPSSVVREGYLPDAIEGTGVPPAAAHQDFLRHFSATTPASTQPSSNTKAPQKSFSGTITPSSLTTPEGDLLWTVLQNVERAHVLAEVLDHQWIQTHSPEGKLLARILAEATVDRLEDTQQLQSLLDSQELQDTFARVFTQERPHTDPQDLASHAARSLVRRYCRQQIDTLNQQIANRSASHPDDPAIRQCMADIAALTRQRLNGPFPNISFSDNPAEA